ncbi:polysaccharide deacetylase family protein [Jeongeupia naejangsanensis]|uniref:Polysaccharide deacetylase family protein n=1 Tax=Jeongeupia naejangsanensis TaxID=613195 RepID=A0ABS2BMT9_9NEIS|nr:polysaccharide deacetylase family protein [Jeongeupia naejangsanensis]MBM3116878.1 polysaccharide deacetylase family protein [Jeongeupia naejangsanensis]
MTLQQKLGFDADARVLILHADDIGMCQATVSAWASLVEFGLMTSASSMPACSWFPSTALAAKPLGQRADLGVHLTLNCEWDHYRWGPITRTTPEDGLTGPEGYFHPLAKPTHEHARVDAVRTELTAQIDRAIAAGVELTHLDSHMLTMFSPALLPVYLDLAHQYRLPPLIPRWSAADIAEWCVLDPAVAQTMHEQLTVREAAGETVLIDSFNALPFDEAFELEERRSWALKWLDTLEAGVHCLVGHPADDTPELRAIAADWRVRTGDRALFADPLFRDAIAERGFKLIGLREIRDAAYPR